LEIYVPIRLEGSGGRVIAVAETYQVADRLRKDLLYIRLETWLIVTGLSLLMTAILFIIVRRGSSTILRQSLRLSKQVSQLLNALERVRTLNALVDDAKQRSVASTERYIRRIGSDLHDGPAQQIGLALLLVEKLNVDDAHASSDAAARINDLLFNALVEIRSIAAGLTTPELDQLSIEEALLRVAEKHEWKTGTEVATSIISVPENLPPLVKINLFRFAQEGLNNAFKHGEGKDQTLRAFYDGSDFIVEIMDSGAGFHTSAGPDNRPKLGLAIMRDRIESLNGTFEIESRVGGGTLVRASFKISRDAAYQEPA
jgi:signal transduction histidine kinase